MKPGLLGIFARKPLTDRPAFVTEGWLDKINRWSLGWIFGAARGMRRRRSTAPAGSPQQGHDAESETSPGAAPTNLTQDPPSHPPKDGKPKNRSRRHAA